MYVSLIFNIHGRQPLKPLSHQRQDQEWVNFSSPFPRPSTQVSRTTPHPHPTHTHAQDQEKIAL